MRWQTGTLPPAPVWLALCFLLLPAGVAVPGEKAQEKKGEKKSGQEYAGDLQAFLEEMDRTYPFFDLKDIRRGWAAQKKLLLKRALACSSDTEFLGIVLDTMKYLRDGHMRFLKVNAEFPPGEPEYYPGISFLPATNNRVVVLYPPEKFSKELKTGTVITHIDGKNVRSLLELKSREAWLKGGFFSSPQRARLFEYRIPLRGKKKGEKHKITYLDGRRKRTVELTSDLEPRGWPHTYNMPGGLSRVGRSCLQGKLPGGPGYIYLRRIDGSTEPGIDAALSAHGDAKGWIIDLRGNGGGGYSGGLIGKIGKLPRPVAVLIDAGCYSAGETLARDIVRYARARLFGSRTAGSSSAKRAWSFPSGIATLSLPTRSRGGLRRCIEFFGIQPHVEVEAVPEEVAAGKNSAILRAEEYLLGELKKGGK